MGSALRVALVAALLAPACAPQACSDQDEQRTVHAVQVLVGEPGEAADAAEEALVARGSDAIQYLETGLYDAEPRARRRVVRVLVKIGDPAAAPILDHLAARDPDPEVRQAAAEGRRALNGARSP